MNFWSILFTSIGGTSVVIGVCVWFLRKWLLEKLAASVKHKYDVDLKACQHDLDKRLKDHEQVLSEQAKDYQHGLNKELEAYKGELKSESDEQLVRLKHDFELKTQRLEHTSEMNRLRTSLFFEHQREAYGEILVGLTELQKEWLADIDWGVDPVPPVPEESYNHLKKVFTQHTLFLDDDGLLGLDMIQSAYDAITIHDAKGGGDWIPEYSVYLIDYTTPRIASVFRHKIGLNGNETALRELALLCSVRLLRLYRETGELASDSPLAYDFSESPEDLVAKAEINIEHLKYELELVADRLKSQEPRVDYVLRKFTYIQSILGVGKDASDASSDQAKTF